MLFRRIISTIAIVALSAFAVVAQEGNSYFGDGNQPGNRLHSNISTLIEQGQEQNSAIGSAVDSSLSEDDSTLTGEAKSAVAFDVALANDFYAEMIQSNSLIEVTKVLIESNTDKAVQVITLGTVLYPDYAQEVFDGAALTGVIIPEDILIAILQAGADPTTVSSATAAGATAAGPGTAVVPLGAGIGAGGTGGGDTTASTN